MESLRVKIEELVNRNWISREMVQAAFADGLNLQNENMNEHSTFYTDAGVAIRDSDVPVSMENLPPQYILKKLTNVGIDLANTIAKAETSGTPLTMKDVYLLLDSIRETNECVPSRYNNDEPDLLQMEKFPSEIKERLEAGLQWEVRREHGMGVEIEQAHKGENLLRCLKAKYAIARTQLELGGVAIQYEPTLKKVIGEKDNTKIVHVYDIMKNTKLAIEFTNNGTTRTFKAIKKRDGTWTEASCIGCVEFPMSETAHKKDKQSNRYQFITLPAIPALVSVLCSTQHRLHLLDIYHDIFDNVKKSIETEIESQVSCTYITISFDDLGRISDYNDDEFDALDVQEEPDLTYKETLPSGNPVDSSWSNAAIAAVFEELDPNGYGFATHPSKSRGHKSVKQSLFWLMGGKSRKRKNPDGSFKWMRGFVSHSALTRQNREDLMLFAKKSWEQINNTASAFVSCETTACQEDLDILKALS